MIRLWICHLNYGHHISGLKLLDHLDHSNFSLIPGLYDLHELNNDNIVVPMELLTVSIIDILAI